MVQNKNFTARQIQNLTVLFSTLVIAIFSSCDQEPLKVGIGIISMDTLEVVIDTFPAELYTRELVPQVEFNTRESPLGYKSDDVFGSQKADFVTTFIPDGIFELFTGTDSVREKIEILSLDLHLAHSTLFGDIDDIDFNVYELTEKIPNSGYSSYTPTGKYNPTPINIGSPALLNDTSTILSIPLSLDFAEKFKECDRMSNHCGFAATDSCPYFKEFQSVFYGLYLEAKSDESKKAMITVDHAADSTLLVLVTRKLNSSAKYDTSIYKFMLANSDYPDNNNHLNIYQKENSSLINNIINDSLTLHSNAYIQGLTGPQVLVKIPDLDILRVELGRKIIVNKAELILNIDKYFSKTDEFEKHPPMLILTDAVTNHSILDDIFIYGYPGGEYDSTQFEYRVNCANNIHAYLQSTNDTTYSSSFYVNSRYLKTYYNSSGILTEKRINMAGQIILMNKYTTSPPLLRIIYTKMPE